MPAQLCAVEVDGGDVVYPLEAQKGPVCAAQLDFKGTSVPPVQTIHPLAFVVLGAIEGVIDPVEG